MLDASVRAHASRPLFGTRDARGTWTWMTYAEFASRVADLRGGLAKLGVTRGDRVAIVSRNRVEWAVGLHAAAGLGAAYVPMYESQVERDWRHILEDSGAKTCLVSGSVATRVAEVARPVSTVQALVDLDAADGYARLLEEGAKHPVAALVPDPSDLAEIVYTSGTTGTPKGVLLTHANLVRNVDAVTQVLPLTHEDRSLAFLPWAHVFGGDELNGIMLLGASTAICESVDQLAEQMLEVKPTALFAVPRVWNKVYQSLLAKVAQQPKLVQTIFRRGTRVAQRKRRGEAVGTWDAMALAIADKLVFARIRERFGGRLAYAVSSAAALSPEVAHLIDALGIVVLEAYGLTETSACATINRPDERRIGSVGKPVPGVEVILDRTVSGGETDVGEIVVYGHGVMAGYHNLPEETAKALTPDGGLRTGDLGRFDEQGFLYVTGRLKELYKLENGKYVVPAPLEETLTLSPYIEQAFVYGADKPTNVALLVPARAALLAWAKEHGKEGVEYASLLRDEEVRALIAAEIARASEAFRGYERIARFALLEAPFSTQNGLLTPTLKTKRREVMKRYRDVLDTLYAPEAERPPSPATAPEARR